MPLLVGTLLAQELLELLGEIIGRGNGSLGSSIEVALQHLHETARLVVVGHGIVVTHLPRLDLVAEQGVASGDIEYVLEVTQQCGSGPGVLGIHQVVRHGHTERHGRD